MAVSNNSIPLPKRRLIACCDGTWNTPDRQGHTTNVVRLVRSIRSCAQDGISQIVFYHPGVGTGNVLDKWLGGGTCESAPNRDPAAARVKTLIICANPLNWGSRSAPTGTPPKR
jgi:hypothetical protein